LRFLQQRRFGLTLPPVPLLARPDRTFGFDHPSETAAGGQEKSNATLIRSLGGDREFPGLVPGMAFIALLPFPNGLARSALCIAANVAGRAGFPFGHL